MLEVRALPPEPNNETVEQRNRKVNMANKDEIKRQYDECRAELTELTREMEALGLTKASQTALVGSMARMLEAYSEINQGLSHSVMTLMLCAPDGKREASKELAERLLGNISHALDLIIRRIANEMDNPDSCYNGDEIRNLIEELDGMHSNPNVSHDEMIRKIGETVYKDDPEGQARLKAEMDDMLKEMRARGLDPLKPKDMPPDDFKYI